MPELPESPRVLLVDDMESDRELLKDALQGHSPGAAPFTLLEASGGAVALEMLAANAPVAVVVSDMGMPGMSGSELLAQVAMKFPETVRVMVTVRDDQAAAVSAINDGAVFRFVTKPFAAAAFRRVVNQCVAQHRLQTAERDLLSQTVMGAVSVLMDLFSRASPVAYARASRVRRIARGIATALGASVWEIELAAVLSQIGFGPDSEEVLRKSLAGRPLTPAEIEVYNSYSTRGAALLARIPRLESLAEIIRYQEEAALLSRGRGTTPSRPQGARILKVALDFDRELLAGEAPAAAFELLRARGALYHPAVIAALQSTLPEIASVGEDRAA